MFDKIKQFKEVITFVAVIITMTIGAMTYFTPAEAFRQHVKDSRIKELISITTQYEIAYKCYREECLSVMPALLYAKYKEMYMELDELQKKSN